MRTLSLFLILLTLLTTVFALPASAKGKPKTKCPVDELSKLIETESRIEDTYLIQETQNYLKFSMEKPAWGELFIRQEMRGQQPDGNPQGDWVQSTEESALEAYRKLLRIGRVIARSQDSNLLSKLINLGALVEHEFNTYTKGNSDTIDCLLGRGCDSTAHAKLLTALVEDLRLSDAKGPFALRAHDGAVPVYLDPKHGVRINLLSSAPAERSKDEKYFRSDVWLRLFLHRVTQDESICPNDSMIHLAKEKNVSAPVSRRATGSASSSGAGAR